MIAIIGWVLLGLFLVWFALGIAGMIGMAVADVRRDFAAQREDEAAGRPVRSLDERMIDERIQWVLDERRRQQ